MITKNMICVGHYVYSTKTKQIFKCIEVVSTKEAIFKNISDPNHIVRNEPVYSETFIRADGKQ